MNRDQSLNNSDEVWYLNIGIKAIIPQMRFGTLIVMLGLHITHQKLISPSTQRFQFRSEVGNICGATNGGGTKLLLRKHREE